MDLSATNQQRLIGEKHGRRDGPCVIVVAGLHGNETAGIDAAQQVLATLTRGEIPLRGDLYAIRGNVSALQENRRFVDRDLNRIWRPDQVDSISRHCPDDLEEVEFRELRELRATIDQALQQARGGGLILDLHSSSSVSPPFTLEGHHLVDGRSRQILEVPAVIDTAGFFGGTFMNFFRSQGFLAVIFEAGQNLADETIRNHETAIWATLVGLGVVQESDLPELVPARGSYHDGASSLPSRLELFYRHAIQPTDNFQMSPGFRNFDRVDEQQILGHDDQGPVLSPSDGRIFLPLYQSTGEDGFFLVRDV